MNSHVYFHWLVKTLYLRFGGFSDHLAVLTGRPWAMLFLFLTCIDTNCVYIHAYIRHRKIRPS